MPARPVIYDRVSVKHFAVVTNDWETDGQALLTWQRGKAGTIEHVNYILKDELAAGGYPSDKFGANAAWLRLPVLTHNLLELLKATALAPPTAARGPSGCASRSSRSSGGSCVMPASSACAG